MGTLFHRPKTLSMRYGIVALGLAAAAGFGISGFGQQEDTGPSPYPGRWTVATIEDAEDSDAEPVSARGLIYHTIDMAPCGKDLCAVSVGANDACGALLFKIAAKKAADFDYLEGRALWGKGKKNLVIYMARGDTPDQNSFDLYIGDGHDFGERSDNIPKYYAYYTPAGAAKCVVTPA
jgi:hypothetical protein